MDRHILLEHLVHDIRRYEQTSGAAQMRAADTLVRTARCFVRQILKDNKAENDLILSLIEEGDTLNIFKKRLND